MFHKYLLCPCQAIPSSFKNPFPSKHLLPVLIWRPSLPPTCPVPRALPWSSVHPPVGFLQLTPQLGKSALLLSHTAQHFGSVLKCIRNYLRSQNCKILKIPEVVQLLLLPPSHQELCFLHLIALSQPLKVHQQSVHPNVDLDLDCPLPSLSLGTCQACHLPLKPLQQGFQLILGKLKLLTRHPL